MLTNFPKLHSPFVRRLFKVDKEVLNKFLSSRNLRPSNDGHLYLVVNEVNPGYEWVFEDKETIAVEKLDGTNVKILIKDKRLDTVQNRLNPPIDLLRIDIDNWRFAEGILSTLSKKFIKQDGKYAGELLGPLVQGNPYKLSSHEWYPFEKSVDSLKYKSFEKYERTFDNLQSWFKDYLKSLYFAKRHDLHLKESIFAEGIVFYNLKRKAEGHGIWMTKLRRDMFKFFYEGVEIPKEPIRLPHECFETSCLYYGNNHGCTQDVCIKY